VSKYFKFSRFFLCSVAKSDVMKIADVDECELFSANCEHFCRDKKIGFECYCRPGYRVDPTKSTSCIDENECLRRPCSQICTNNEGSYTCDCAKGYVLLKDMHSCKIDGVYVIHLVRILCHCLSK
jgi:integrin beta 2